MLELTPNGPGRKGPRPRFLEHNGDNVVADMPFPHELLAIVGRKRE